MSTGSTVIVQLLLSVPVQWDAPSPLKIASFSGGSEPMAMVPLANLSPEPKLQFDRFTRFCRAHYCDRQTDRQTTLLGL